MKTLEIGNLVRQVTKLDEETSGINLARICKGDGRNLLTVLGVDTVAEAGAALKAKSDAKDYTGLMLGDYLDITSDYEGTSKTVRYEIASFGHYHWFWNGTQEEWGLGCITFLAKDVIYNRRINDTNDSHYSTSEIRSVLNGSIYNSLKSALGDIDFKRIIWWHYFNNGTYAAPDWTTETDDRDKHAEFVYLPSSRELRGEAGLGCDFADNSSQFPLLTIAPGRIPCKDENGNYKWHWTRTPSQTPGYFCDVYGYGNSHNHWASYTDGGVRPAFNL